MTHLESRERNKQIVIDYLAGMSREEIRIKYNIKHLSGYLIGVKRDRKTYARKITDRVKEKIIELHSQGKNCYEIESEIGSGFRYISTKLKEWGYKPNRKMRDKKITVKEVKEEIELRELTPGEQRIKDKLRSWDLMLSFRREGGVPMNYGSLEPLITIKPRNYF